MLHKFEYNGGGVTIYYAINKDTGIVAKSSGENIIYYRYYINDWYITSAKKTCPKGMDIEEYITNCCAKSVEREYREDNKIDFLFQMN